MSKATVKYLPFAEIFGSSLGTVWIITYPRGVVTVSHTTPGPVAGTSERETGPANRTSGSVDRRVCSPIECGDV